MFRFAGNGQFDFGRTQPFTIYSAPGTGISWQFGLRPSIVSRFRTRDSQLLLKSADFRLGIPVAFPRGELVGARGALPPQLASRRGFCRCESCCELLL